jgi:hypothetical protein
MARVDYRIRFKQAQMPRHGERTHDVFSPTKDAAIKAAKAIIDASYYGEDAIITHIVVLAEHKAEVVFEYPRGAAKLLLGDVMEITE